jgi:acyl-CoA thioesterase YciA
MSDPTLTEESLALRVHMMPHMANYLGTIFGGTILSLIDQAGFHQALRHGRHRWVTAAVDAVVFHDPVYIGDIVTLYTRTVRTGRTSLQVQVRVVATRVETGENVDVTDATLTMVAVEASGRPIPWSSPPTAGRHLTP